MRSHLSYAPCKTHVHHRGTITTPTSCTVHSISRTFQGLASSATAQPGIGFSVAEILDPANFKRSYGSSEKDADREPAGLLLRLLIISCLLCPLPFIYWELSRKFQSVVSNSKHTSIFFR